MSISFPSGAWMRQRPAKSSLVISLASLMAACGTDDNASNTTNDVPNSPTQTVTDSFSEAPVKANLVVTSANDTTVAETNIDELNIIFQVSASFDAKALGDQAVINLGLDRDGNEVASLGRADFDELSVENATLNIHATQQNIEVDHKKGVEGNLTINFENNDGPVLVGRDDYEMSPNQSIQVFDAKTLNIHHLTDQTVFAQGSVLVDGFTEDIVVTTSKSGGDLTISGSEAKATFADTGELKTFTVNAVNGDLLLDTFDPVHGVSHLIDDATNFQALDVRGHDAFIEVGSIGYLQTQLSGVTTPGGIVYSYTGFAPDLETINIELTGSASLLQHYISAHPANIAEVNIKAGAGDTVSTRFNLNSTITYEDANVVINGLAADSVEQMVIDTPLGGSVLLHSQSYEVSNLTFMGSGEIIIAGPADADQADALAGGLENAGFRQVGPADASDHTGDRFFVGRIGTDIIYGSTKDDTIIFQKYGVMPFSDPLVRQDFGDTYLDSGGNDTVYISGFSPVYVYDGNAGTDDTYVFEVLPYTSGFSPGVMYFHAGSGNDTVELAVFQPLIFPPRLHEVSLDFGTWLDGHVHVTRFLTGEYKISLDGLPGITNPNVTQVSPGTTTIARIDDNATYLGFDGDQMLNGYVVTDYHDLEEVARYLDAVVSNSSRPGDSAVFILENSTSSSAAGDDADYYFYLFNESDGISGISDEEISHFASLELFTGFPASAGPLSAADFV